MKKKLVSVLGLLAVLAAMFLGAASSANASANVRTGCTSNTLNVLSSGTHDCFSGPSGSIDYVQLPDSTTWNYGGYSHLELRVYPCSNYTQNTACAQGGIKYIEEPAGGAHRGYNEYDFPIDIVGIKYG